MKILYFDCFSGISGDMLVGALLDLGVEWSVLEAAINSLGLPALELSRTKVVRSSLAACKFTVKVSNIDEDTGHLVLPTPVSHSHHHSTEHHHPHSEGSHSHHHNHELVSHSHHHNTEHHHESGHSHHHHGPQETVSPSDPHHSSHHHHHDDGHSHHHHRHYQEVAAIIEQGTLSDWVKTTAKRIFWRLTEAEAAVHGVDPHKVALHEVGAADAIVDVVAACVGLEYLKIDKFMASPLHVGQGFVDCAHGRYPVPVPGALQLLNGVPTYATAIRGELVTPTGAAIVTTLCSNFGPLPLMTVEKVGYGAGNRDISNFPNVLRVICGEFPNFEAIIATPTTMQSASITNEVVTTSEQMVVVEANIDDLNPQIYGYLLEELLKLGAVDVYYTPIYMKKNRPGTLLTLIAPAEAIPTLISKVLRETTTLGVRQYPVNRQILARQIIPIATDWGTVRVKLAFSGEEMINFMPEYEDCVKLAQTQQVPLSLVQAAAQNIALATYGGGGQKRSE
jgi:pyridinium-3,5-bisthiocarboxylic acid mononucleotide nickel chelatase